MPTATLKCTYCKERFPREQIKKFDMLFGRFCCKEHMVEHGLKQSRKMREKSKKKKDAEFKKKVIENDLPRQLKLTQKVFNRLRVLQEKKWFEERGLPVTCTSCGRTVGNDIWSCGHLKTVGSNSALRFSEKNTFIQHLKNCNKEKSGDIENYKKGLISRFGEIEGNNIIEFCENHERLRKWKCEELIIMRTAFNAEIRVIEEY